MAILDRAAQLKLNAVIFQVRPGCDALYQSSLEPWSEYLTGTMWQPPQPFYDPLLFAVQEAHKRGLELHAWFNPYRAHHPSGKSPIAANHISRTHPELVRQYGKLLWLDPGEKAVQDYSLQVILDVVKRYDVDGIHFDDYFYPYKERDETGKNLDFPDEASWQRYGAGGRLNRDDWRRENVNVFIRRAYQAIKATKPWVKFGLSPFGIWRPGNPPQIKGFDAYSELYADSRKWLANGWLDYFAPQLYWGINPPEQSCPGLLRWWAAQNAKDRLLAPGMDSTRASRRSDPEEIVREIRLTRQQPGAEGHIHWNMRALMRNSSLDAALEQEVYQQAALVPALPWLGRTMPKKPALTVAGGKSPVEVSWRAGKQEQAWLWLLQVRRGKDWTTMVLPGTQGSCALAQPAPNVIALTAVDRFGNTGRPAVVARKD